MPEAIRILIAENDPRDAELMVRELRRAGFEPDWRRVDAERDYLQALGPDLDVVLSDYSMPQFDGPRALRLLRERGLDTPFILVSGTVGEDVAVAAMKEGANDYLIKDRLTRLGTAVRQAIAQRRERQQRARVEAQLHENVRLLIQQAPLSIAMLDRDMRYLATSQRWIEEYGRGHEDLIGRSHYDVFPDLPEAWKEAHRRGQAGEVVKNEEDSWLEADGSRQWLRWAVHPWRDVQGAIGGIIISADNITPQKQAELALRAGEERTRFALETVGLGAWDLDLVDHSAHRTLGHDRVFGYETLLPHWTYEMFLEHVWPDDRAEVDRRFREATATQGDWSFDCRIRRADGELRWIWAAGRHRLDENGQATRMTGIVQDITERKQVEAAVREGEARLSGVVDSAMDAIITAGADQRVVLFNTAAERMFRCSRDQAMGRPIDAFIPARFRDGHAQNVERFGTTGVTSRAMGALGAISGLRADGEEFPIEASISQTDAAGNRLYTVILRDITERRRAERWQAMQHAVTQVLADSTSLAAAAPRIIQAVCETLGGRFGAIWDIDRRGNVLRCADVWHVPGLMADGLLAQTRQISFAPGIGLPGRVWASGKPIVVSDVAQDASFLRAAPATKAGLCGAFGFPILLRDEVAGVIDFLGPELRQPGAELLTMLSAIGSQIGQFIEHRSAERQLLQAQKMEAVGQLAGGIAHDFNNLLGVILGYAQLASQELGPEHKTNHRIAAVCKAAESAAALTRQILTFSRKQAVDTRVCNLNQIVEEMEKMLRRLIGEDVRLSVGLDEHLGRVRADPGQMEQVIMNLAVNARDAMPAGGRLVIETSNVDLDDAYAASHPEVRPGPHVMLAVGDTGQGIEPGLLARIFEPFFTTKELGKGTGLGLAVVFGIVKQSGGSLSVYSEPGRGSTFKVYLPRVEETEPAASGPAGEVASGGSETVLLVEDEDALRALVAETLTEAGYTVLEASDPLAAAAIAAEGAQVIHLLLTDVVLPGQSGPATALQLRHAHPRMRVLLMSGYTDRLLNGQRDALVDTRFLSKPFTIDALLRKVREVLDAP